MMMLGSFLCGEKQNLKCQCDTSPSSLLFIERPLELVSIGKGVGTPKDKPGSLLSRSWVLSDVRSLWMHLYCLPKFS